MEKNSRIGMGQLIAILLSSRLAVSLTTAPTMHAVSNGTDFLLSIILHSLLMLIVLLPVWWFSRRSGGASTLDYAFALFGRGGGVAVALAYALLCLYIQTVDLLRFDHFLATTLSPDLSRVAICAALVLAAFAAGLYGLQAVARAATLVTFLTVVCVAFIALALLPEMDTAYFPPLLYNGVSPVISGALEELPRTLEITVIGLLLPYVKGNMVKGCLKWAGLFAVVALVVQLTVVGVLGDFTGMVQFPYYTAVTAAQVSVLQRLDIVAAAIWSALLLIKMAFFAVLFLSAVQRAFGGRGHVLYALIGAVAVWLPAVLLGGFPMEQQRPVLWGVSAVVMGVFAVLLPLLLIAADALHRRQQPTTGKEAVRT